MFDDLRDLYQDAVMARAKAPHRARRLEVFDATAKGDNPMCGDRVQVWLKRDAGGRIADLGFEARGCHISIAAADLMGDAVIGRTAEQVRTMETAFREMVLTGEPGPAILEPLRPLSGVHEFPSRTKCATLSWDALMAALTSTEEPSHG